MRCTGTQCPPPLSDGRLYLDRMLQRARFISRNDRIEPFKRRVSSREEDVPSAEELSRGKKRLTGDGAGLALPAEPAPGAGTMRARRSLRMADHLLVGLALVGVNTFIAANWVAMAAQPHVSIVAATKAPGWATRLVPSGKASLAPRVNRGLPAAQQLALAFDAAFGPRARTVGVGVLNGYRYYGGQVVWTDFGPILVTNGAAEAATPATAGTLGIFYLRETANGAFAEVRRWHAAIRGSPLGNPPRWIVRHDVTSKPVIETNAFGTWQGYACGTTTLTALTADGPTPLVTFATAYDSTGARGPSGERYRGEIMNVVRGRSFDVRYAGTQTLISRFVRQGTVYVLDATVDASGAPAKVATC